MRLRKRWMSALAVPPMLALVAFAYAKEHDELSPYTLLTTISIPGFGNGFDISWVDSEASRYYLANRGNAAAVPPVVAHIDVIDTRRLKLLIRSPCTPRVTASSQFAPGTTRVNGAARARMSCGSATL